MHGLPAFVNEVDGIFIPPMTSSLSHDMIAGFGPRHEPLDALSILG